MWAFPYYFSFPAGGGGETCPHHPRPEIPSRFHLWGPVRCLTSSLRVLAQLLIAAGALSVLLQCWWGAQGGVGMGLRSVRAPGSGAALPPLGTAVPPAL